MLGRYYGPKFATTARAQLLWDTTTRIGCGYASHCSHSSNSEYEDSFGAHAVGVWLSERVGRGRRPPAPAGRSATPLSEYSRGSQIAHLNDEDCRPPHAADPEVDIDMELNISVGLESDPSSELLDSIPTAEVSLADEYDDGEASSDLGLGDDGRAAAGS